MSGSSHGSARNLGAYRIKGAGRLTPARTARFTFDGRSYTAMEGDTVASGDVIAEIETDKATMEVEAVDEGVIGKLLVDAGTENVKVNTPIAVLLQEGESADAISAEKPAQPQAAKADADTPAATADDAGGKAREASAEPSSSADNKVPAQPKLDVAADPDIPAGT